MLVGLAFLIFLIRAGLSLRASNAIAAGSGHLHSRMMRSRVLSMRMPGRLLATALAVSLGALAWAQNQEPTLKTPQTVKNRLDALIADGSFNDALALIRAEEKLGPLPPDLQLKRGIVLVQLGDTEEATRVFQKLRDNYPDQPAPYVNLAAIHARADDLESARQELDHAVTLAPKQASTQESLGKIHLGLAWKSFKLAAELDPSRQNLLQKNRIIEQLIQERQAPLQAQTNPPPALEPAAAPRPAAAPPAPVNPSAETPLPASKPPAAAPVWAAEACASGSSAPCTQALRALEDWRQAWTQRSFDLYRQFYAPDFQPEGFRSQAEWERYKKRVFRQADFIQVSLRILKVQTLDASRIRVRAEQGYASNRFKDKTQKMLELVLENGRWKIAAEQVV